MGAFEVLTQTLFAQPHLRLSATYLPVDGDAYAVRVIRRTPQLQEVSLGRTAAHIPAYGFDVLASEVSQPVQGDELIVGEDRFTVISSELDTEKLVWKLNLDKIDD